MSTRDLAEFYPAAQTSAAIRESLQGIDVEEAELAAHIIALMDQRKVMIRTATDAEILAVEAKIKATELRIERLHVTREDVVAQAPGVELAERIAERDRLVAEANAMTKQVEAKFQSEYVDVATRVAAFLGLLVACEASVHRARRVVAQVGRQAGGDAADLLVLNDLLVPPGPPDYARFNGSFSDLVVLPSPRGYLNQHAIWHSRSSYLRGSEPIRTAVAPPPRLPYAPALPQPGEWSPHFASGDRVTNPDGSTVDSKGMAVVRLTREGAG